MTDLQVARWPVERLIPYARNSRTHSAEQVAQIAASIAEFGWTSPILTGSDGIIIAGHARLQAARKLGMTEVPVIVLEHLTETQRRALVIADNQLAISGASWDAEMLRVELDALREDDFDIGLLGFGDEEIEALLAEPGEAVAGKTDEDAVPETPETAVTLPGDVWILGEHRLLCGDATQIDAVEKVLAGGLVDMTFCDPPYNVNYGATTSAWSPLRSGSGRRTHTGTREVLRGLWRGPHSAKPERGRWVALRLALAARRSRR